MMSIFMQKQAFLGVFRPIVKVGEDNSGVWMDLKKYFLCEKPRKVLHYLHRVIFGTFCADKFHEKLPFFADRHGKVKESERYVL